MIKKLQNVFPTLIIYSEANDIRLENYDWFITKDDDVFGISKKELTKKDQTLLATLLQPYYPNLPLQTKVENVWINEINGVQQETTLQIITHFASSIFQLQKIRSIQLILERPLMNCSLKKFLSYGKMKMKES